MKMGEALFARSFVGGSYVRPDLQLHDRRAMALAEKDREAIVEDLFVSGGRVQSAQRVPDAVVLRPRR